MWYVTVKGTNTYGFVLIFQLLQVFVAIPNAMLEKLAGHVLKTVVIVVRSNNKIFAY